MGCCSSHTVDPSTDIKTLDANQLRQRVTPHQLAMIIKVQAHIRGLLTRKNIRHMQYNAGMGGYMHGDEADDYDNPKVQVSLTNFHFNATFLLIANQRRARRVRL